MLPLRTLVLSYNPSNPRNPSNPTAFRLMQGGEEVRATSIPAEIGVFGQATQAFAFECVAPGTYALAIAKVAHAPITVQTVFVGDKDVDITQDSRPKVRLMELLQRVAFAPVALFREQLGTTLAITIQ